MTIELTGFRSDDEALLHAWRQDADLRDGTLGHVAPASAASERDWIASFRLGATGGSICLAAREAADRPLIGYVQLRDIDWISRTAEVGIVVGPAAARGAGTGARLLERLADFAFVELRLRRLWLRVAAFNEAAIALYRRHGFVEEGRLKNHVYRRGALHDVLLFGLERPD
jgi:RimJ/RimL family protein N-acetyltransferase